MAPIRITSSSSSSFHLRRRRSSLALNPFTPAKPGLYGINRPVTFAPNVTPGTYVEPEDEESADFSHTTNITDSLFPPSESHSFLPTTTKKRCPPGKRRSQGYIPRPPNAFMLFRADFVRQKHVPGSIETNHGSLSKIIGNCWRALPLDEKRIWEVKAKHAKAEHKARYPNYRFRPVHNKNKDKDNKDGSVMMKKKEKHHPTIEDERRCEQVALLLMEGKKGDELAAAIRDLETLRRRDSRTLPEQQHHASLLLPRRPSSVPLPTDIFNPYFTNIALPSLPQMTLSSSSRPCSPVSRQLLGTRRPSSAGPTFMPRSWTFPIFNQDVTPTPLPAPDTSLFNSSWSNSFPAQSPSTNTTTTITTVEDNNSLFTNNYDMMTLQAPIPMHHHQHTLDPLDPTSVPPLDMSWIQIGLDTVDTSFSKQSSVYSGSPEPADFLPSQPFIYPDSSSYPSQSYNFTDFGNFCAPTTTMNDLFTGFSTTFNDSNAFYDIVVNE